MGREIGPADCTIEHRLAVLHDVPFFSHLPSDRLSQINQRFHAYGYEPGETIYFSGDPAERLYVVTDGEVKLLRHSANGQDVLLDILGSGEMFGSFAALGDRTYPDTAEAQTACCVLSISASDFQTVLERFPEIAVTVLSIVARRLQEAQDTVSQISATQVDARVAAVLLKLAEKLGVEEDGGIVIQTRISRQDIAAMTGTTTETVSRVMSQFRRDGLIGGGRQWIVITAPDRLSDIAESV
jgi:CRP-like cAMP-binding protein